MLYGKYSYVAWKMSSSFGIHWGETCHAFWLHQNSADFLDRKTYRSNRRTQSRNIKKIKEHLIREHDLYYSIFCWIWNDSTLKLASYDVQLATWLRQWGQEQPKGGYQQNMGKFRSKYGAANSMFGPSLQLQCAIFRPRSAKTLRICFHQSAITLGPWCQPGINELNEPWPLSWLSPT